LLQWFAGIRNKGSKVQCDLLTPSRVRVMKQTHYVVEEQNFYSFNGKKEPGRVVRIKPELHPQG
jgi:hypothetical protein